MRYHQDNYLLIKVACRQDGVQQFWPISSCIEDDLKFGAVILWSKDGSESRSHSHTWSVLKVVAVIVFRWNKIVTVHASCSLMLTGGTIIQYKYITNTSTRSIYTTNDDVSPWFGQKLHLTLHMIWWFHEWRICIHTHW